MNAHLDSITTAQHSTAQHSTAQHKPLSPTGSSGFSPLQGELVTPLQSSLDQATPQVVSKKRVADHGEVYTHPREVNAMLDLVKHETERIDSRFLEPACGTGNFLVEILRRKLAVVEARYKKSQFEFERYAVIAVSSIYGIDILADNVAACQLRLFDIFDRVYTGLYKGDCKEACHQSVQFILSKNILHGDALTLKTVAEPAQPIVFSEWTAVNGSQIQRRDFSYDYLVKFSTPPPPDDLFSVENINRTEKANAKLQKSDVGEYSYEISPIKDYPLVHFLDIAKTFGAPIQEVRHD